MKNKNYGFITRKGGAQTIDPCAGCVKIREGKETRQRHGESLSAPLFKSRETGG